MSCHSVHGVCHSPSSRCRLRQTGKTCSALLLRNERSGSSLEIAESRFQDADGTNLVTPHSMSSKCFGSCPVITSLVLVTLLCISFHGNTMITAVFCQAEDHFQKPSGRSSRPSPYCSPAELRTHPVCTSPWGSHTGVLVLWDPVLLARVSDHIFNLFPFMRLTSHHLFAPSLRLCHVCGSCRKGVNVLRNPTLIANF